MIRLFKFGPELRPILSPCPCFNINATILPPDLQRLEEFISDLSGSVLHPHHYLLLLARRNYKFISQKRLIGELAVCEPGQQDRLKERFRVKLEQMSQYDQVAKTLLGED